MKKLLALSLLGAALAVPATADLCTIEATPAATLLLPYFEVDLGNPAGMDTFFSINNAADYSVMTHVIVWTDLSVEALDFNVYLTGYDVQTIAMGLMIRSGILPVTGDSDDISNRGAFSDLHPGEQDEVDGYPGCTAIDFPYDEPELSEEFLEQHLQPLLTGGPSSIIYSGRCGGVDHGDDIARGYVTVDVTNDCTLLRPCDAGYFYGANQVGEYDNVLWGDWYMVDGANNFAQGDNLVHLEAFFEKQVFADDLIINSFYERCWFANPDHAPQGVAYIGFADFRESLGSHYATRFYQNEAFSGGTDLLVWRDSNMNAAFGEEDGFECADGPSWFLNERQVVIFDEEENPEVPDPCPVSPCPDPDDRILFPYETQRFSVADAGFSPDSGWLFLNLNQIREIDEYLLIFQTQAWVQSVHSADGRFSVGLSAIQLDQQCDFRDVTLGADTDEVDFPLVYDYVTNQGVGQTTYLLPASYQSLIYY